MGVEDELGDVDSYHKQSYSTLKPSENMHIIITVESCETIEHDEHRIESNTKDTK